ncbi:Uncharacterized protein PBTT_02822 [Plasmodiophora brassicae]
MKKSGATAKDKAAAAAAAAAPAEPPPPREPTFFEKLDSVVWKSADRGEQFRAFVKMMDLYYGGVCRQTIIAEELFLLAVHCHGRGLTGERLGLAFSAVKSVFDGLEQHAFQTETDAFNLLRSRIMQCTKSPEAANVDERPPGAPDDGPPPPEPPPKLTVAESCDLIDYAAQTLFAEFDLFAAIFDYPMEHDLVRVTTHVPSALPTHAPLSDATYEPLAMPAQTEGADVNEARRKIIERIADMEISKAEGEVAKTLARHKTDLDAKTEALRAHLVSEGSSHELP